jgi:hypothetical protein
MITWNNAFSRPILELPTTKMTTTTRMLHVLLAQVLLLTTKITRQTLTLQESRTEASELPICPMTDELSGGIQVKVS